MRLAATLLALGVSSAVGAAEPGHDHMIDDPLRAFLLVDRLEWQSDGTGERMAWEAQGWVGKDTHRLWIRSEGERSSGATESSNVEALWGRPVARWWDFVAGVRHDFAPGASRSWAALGVTGVAPYEFEVRITGYLGERGATSLEASVEYELLLTQRWILQPRVEATWFGQSDAARGLESGLSETALGLRLRYEIRREFAPYAGAEWQRHRDRSGDLSFVAGLRVWF